MQILALRFNRLELHLDLSGALWFPGERVLAVADLHLEKGSSYARHGQMLPPYDSTLTLRRLQTAVTRFRPRLLIALGDSFHDKTAAARLSPADAAVVRNLSEHLDFVWVGGNHDPKPPKHLGGRGGFEIEAGVFQDAPAGRAGGGEDQGGHNANLANALTHVISSEARNLRQPDRAQARAILPGSTGEDVSLRST